MCAREKQAHCDFFWAVFRQLLTIRLLQCIIIYIFEERSKLDMSRADLGLIEKIKEYIKSKWGELVVLAVLSALALLFTVIYYSIPFTEYFFNGVERSDVSLWSADLFYLNNPLMPKVNNITGINTYFIIAFVVGIILLVGAVGAQLFKRFNVMFAVCAVYNGVLSLISIIVGVVLGIMRGSAVACGIISIILSMLALSVAILLRKSRKAEGAGSVNGADGDTSVVPALTPAENKRFRIAVLVCKCVALAAVIVSFFIPMYSVKGALPVATAKSAIPISALFSNASVSVNVVFIFMFIAFFALLLRFVFALSGFSRTDNSYIAQSRRFMTGVGAFVLIFFIVGFVMAFYFNVKSDSATTNATYYTVGYIPVLLYTVALIVYSVFYGKLQKGDVGASGDRKPVKIEPLIFVLVSTVITFLSLILNIVKIQVRFAGYVSTQSSVVLSGYKLLTDYKGLGGGYQVLAFMEAAVLLISALLLILSVVSYIAKDRSYYKIVKISAVTNFLLVLFIALFGLYFKIAQKVNIENIESILAYYHITLSGDEYEYDVSSQTIYMLIAGCVVMAAMLIRGIFGLGVEQPAGAVSQGATEERAPYAESAASVQSGMDGDFDACPAFTDLDGRQSAFVAELTERRAHLFANPSLPNMVRFVVDYARESRLHLSYSTEDMATFVAGLGASRLTILQGMSGTGKTSLPKIFTEAIMGNCEIVEVESSWRDKNELLGYYNEFSKCFTPKKFTQCLYKARLNSTVPTLIVLDEMNLSRIEYYFSDFLSLMENEEDKREIKLSNVKLYRRENGQNVPYDGLTDGHTIKIPANVWFIGTANRDESTFAISDKVYDRAQTMNFNKRAPKIYSFGEPLSQRFVPYEILVKLFDAAKSDYVFDAESNVAIQKTEKLLAPYNISFGNRVLRQIEDFVKIYCACFGDKSVAERDAVERILLSKVVSKLENKVVENKDALASEFDKLGLKSCGEFVRRLSED